MKCCFESYGEVCFLRVFPFFQPKLYQLHDDFVIGRSCVTSLLRSICNLSKTIDEKKQLDAVFLDHSKAFD